MEGGDARSRGACSVRDGSLHRGAEHFDSLLCAVKVAEDVTASRVSVVPSRWWRHWLRFGLWTLRIREGVLRAHQDVTRRLEVECGGVALGRTTYFGEALGGTQFFLCVPRGTSF